MFFLISRYKNAVKIQLVLKPKVRTWDRLKRNLLVIVSRLEMRELFKKCTSW